MSPSPARAEAVTRRSIAVGLAAAGGLATALSLPPWGWWPLSFVGIAVFDAAAGTASSRRRRAATGFTFALVWLAVATAWMWQLSAPGYIVANVVFAACHAVAALAVPAGRWSLLGRPLAHTLAEALRMSFPFGGVPLATLGIAQVAGPFAAIARVGGVLALTWFTFQLAVLAGRVVRDRPQLSATGAWATLPLVVLLGAAVVAPDGADTGTTIRIAAVQGGGEQGTRAGDVPPSVVTERHLAATATIEPGAVDVVVWPENAVDVIEFSTSDEMAAIAAAAERLGVPILVGVTEDVPGDPDRFTNAQLVVLPDGELGDRYVKVRRVPFGEYVPLRGLLEALGAPVDQIGRDALAGTDVAVIEAPVGDDDVRFAVAISWEIFFSGRAREGVEAGGSVLLNPTNGASYTGTIVQTQQVASSQLRAIETGRWVVQVAPTGFSAFVSPDGEVIDRTAVSERQVIVHDVALRSGRTWAMRLGEWPWIVALATAYAATVVVASARRGLRRRRSGDAVAAS